MRIAIDCRTLLNPGFGENAGVGHYTYYLLLHLLRLDRENEYILFFDPAIGTSAIQSLVGGRPNTHVRFFPFHAYREYLKGAYSELLTTSAIARTRPDLLHIPGGRIPLTYRAKTVLTVHDLAIMEHPEWFPKQNFATRYLYPKSIANATHIIAVSNATKLDLEKLFSVPSSKISVVYEGVNTEHAKLFTNTTTDREHVIHPAELKHFYKINFPYLLFLGTIEPRKNIVGLLHAFKRLLHSGAMFHNIQLVIAGAKGWHHNNIFELISTINNEFHDKLEHTPINYIGYVQHRYKWLLLKHALAFVFPSFYEGFGLPILEAMSQGTPVVSSDIASIPEIVGDAGILIDPHDKHALFHALRSIILDQTLRTSLAKKAPLQANKFTWEQTAKETLKVYQQVARQ